MIATGAVAFANARVRAMKSRLLGHEIAGRVMAGLAATPDDRLDPVRGFDELIHWYVTVLKSYPRGQPLFRALLRRHEVENIKLLWRVIVTRATDGAWSRYWIDLGRLAAFTLDACRECRTLPALVEALNKTPYASIAHDMWRSHAGDPAAAELGFDRWTSDGIIDAASAFSESDRTAADLALAVVGERNFNIALRLSDPRLPAPQTALPRNWRRHAPPAASHDRFLLWLRQRRRLLCRQAFLETPFCLAPAVALLLLKEEEIRGLDAIASFDPTSADASWLTYALAPSELGA